MKLNFSTLSNGGQSLAALRTHNFPGTVNFRVYDTCCTDYNLRNSDFKGVILPIDYTRSLEESISRARRIPCPYNWGQDSFGAKAFVDPDKGIVYYEFDYLEPVTPISYDDMNQSVASHHSDKNPWEPANLAHLLALRDRFFPGDNGDFQIVAISPLCESAIATGALREDGALLTGLVRWDICIPIRTRILIVRKVDHEAP